MWMSNKRVSHSGLGVCGLISVPEIPLKVRGIMVPVRCSDAMKKVLFGMRKLS